MLSKVSQTKVSNEMETKQIGTSSRYKAVNQLNAIISEIMVSENYPRWDYLNGVLSCEKILGDFELWLHWDSLLVVPKGDRYSGKKAGDFHIMEEWNTENDGTITLILGKKLSDRQ